MAERRGNGPYRKDHKRADLQAVLKAARSVEAPVADRARMEPEALGNYETIDIVAARLINGDARQ